MAVADWRLTIEELSIERLPIDGLMIADWLPDRRLLVRGLGNQQSTMHSTINNQFNNRQPVDPQSPIDNPSIGNLQSPIVNG